MSEETRDILLRPLSLDDVDFMVMLTQNPDVARFIPGMITDEEGLASWIKGLSAHDHEFVILLNDILIGECSLTEKDDCGEIGLMLLPEYWQRGFGTETVHILTSLAESLRLKTLTATTSRLNEPCIRLLQKQGFKQKAIGWMISEEEIELQEPLNQLFGTVIYEKTIGRNIADECNLYL